MKIYILKIDPVVYSLLYAFQSTFTIPIVFLAIYEARVLSAPHDAKCQVYQAYKTTRVATRDPLRFRMPSQMHRLQFTHGQKVN